MFILRRRDAEQVPAAQAEWLGIRPYVLFVALLALAATTRPYVGMVHDARLYFVQVANRMHPGQFAQDLFLAFGSQEKFSLFSSIHAPLVSWLGAAPAAMAYVGILLVFWAATVAVLVRRLAPSDTAAGLAILAVVGATSHYGAYPIFAFAEPFATPRLLAEVLSMAGVVLLEMRRPVAGAVLLAGASATHPLMALPVICWMCVRHLSWRWLATAIGAGGGITIACGLIGIDPFVRLFQQFDADWFAVVQRRLEFALPDAWNPIGWLSSALPVAALLYAAALSRDVRGTMARSLLAVAMVLLTTATLGSLSRNVLLVNLQLWRVLWIVGVVGTGLYATICVDLFHRSSVRYAVALALMLAIVERMAKLPPLASGAIGSVALAAAWMENRNGALPRSIDLLVAAFACFGLCVTLALVWAMAVGNGAPKWLTVVVLDVVVLIGASIVLFRARGMPRGVPLCLAGMLAVVAVARWDRRNALHRYIETEGTAQVEIRDLIRDRIVYWEDGVELLWLQYQMPSYYSCLQGSGAMFYQATAREYHRRGGILARLGGGGFEPSSGGSCEQPGATDRPADVTADALPGVCRDLGDVDILILPRHYRNVTPTATIDVRMMRHRVDGKVLYGPGRVYAYSCATWRI